MPEPESNPYAPPLADLKPPEDTLIVDALTWREATLSLGGWFGLLLAILVFLLFAGGTCHEYNKIVAAEGGFDARKHREWISRITTVGLTSVIAGFASWELRRLREKGRWLLTFMIASPIPATGLCYLVNGATKRVSLDDPTTGVAVSILLAMPFYLYLLIFLWWPSGRELFSLNRVATSGQMGFLPIFGTLGFVFAEGVAYTAFVLCMLAVRHEVGYLVGWINPRRNTPPSQKNPAPIFTVSARIVVLKKKATMQCTVVIRLMIREVRLTSAVAQAVPMTNE